MAEIQLNPKRILEERRKLREVHWYVLNVKLCHERRIAGAIQAKGFPTYVPTKRSLHTWSDRKKWIDKVLTPQMVFVQLALTEKNSVFVDKNVFHFMSAPGISGPAAVPDHQMELFVQLTQRSEEEIAFLKSPLKKGDKVRVLSGSLIGLVGELLHIDGQSKIVLRLNEVLSAAVTMSPDMVEKVKD